MHEWNRRIADLPDNPPRILVPTRAIVLLLGRRRNHHWASAAGLCQGGHSDLDRLTARFRPFPVTQLRIRNGSSC